MPLGQEEDLIEQLGTADTVEDRLQAWHDHARASSDEGRASAMLQQARLAMREGSPVDLIELANEYAAERAAYAGGAVGAAVTHRR